MTKEDTLERILFAAIWYRYGKKYEHQPVNIDTGLVICGRRHHNCFATLLGLLGSIEGNKLVGQRGQGFITNKDRYVDRMKGFLIAKSAGQLLLQIDGDNILTSEDLY